MVQNGNFPTLPKFLEQTLSTQINIESICDKESSVNGFLFEDEFFKERIIVTCRSFSKELEECCRAIATSKVSKVLALPLLLKLSISPTIKACFIISIARQSKPVL